MLVPKAIITGSKNKSVINRTVFSLLRFWSVSAESIDVDTLLDPAVKPRDVDIGFAVRLRLTRLMMIKVMIVAR